MTPANAEDYDRDEGERYVRSEIGFARIYPLRRDPHFDWHIVATTYSPGPTLSVHVSGGFELACSMARTLLGRLAPLDAENRARYYRSLP